MMVEKGKAGPAKEEKVGMLDPYENSREHRTFKFGEGPKMTEAVLSDGTRVITKCGS